MVYYKAPIEDSKFIFNEVINIKELTEISCFSEVSDDIIDAVLEEGSKFCENITLPLNIIGDDLGCKFDNGVVTTPEGFKEAYKQFAENGWTAINGDPDYEGQGLPKTLSTAFSEYSSSCNISLSIYSALTQGAAFLLDKYGSNDIKKTYLTQLNAGNWAGSMCLSEPQCGTDLGLIKTKAEPNGDGTHNITGTKIFITSGEHDLTDNILHLVLARTTGAPAGVKGISLFLVPKFLPNDNAEFTQRNTVECGALEKKMGIKASSTCVMNFDGAKGFLVGKQYGGLEAMFVMMNSERLSAGIQGLGLAEISYQTALDYAKERLQGRALTGTKFPEKAADPIIVHPDVRKMLLTMKAYNEGCRALAYETAKKLDISEKHDDPEKRQEADDFVSLMTPIVKAFFTDICFDSTNIGMQVMGGYGYIKEYGMEQFVRDARIAQIYEGANGIQALDLVGRKLGQGTGRLLRRFFHPIFDFVEANKDNEGLKPLLGPYLKALTKLQQITLLTAQRGLKNPDEAGAASTDYLRFFALVAIGFMWLRMAKTSFDALNSGNLISSENLYRSKIKTARYFIYKLLPQTSGLFLNIASGAEPLMDFEVDEF